MMGKSIPFPRREMILLQKMAGNPILTNPFKNPLVLFRNLQGPSFKNFVIPNAPVKTDEAKVKTNWRSFCV